MGSQRLLRAALAVFTALAAIWPTEGYRTGRIGAPEVFAVRTPRRSKAGSSPAQLQMQMRRPLARRDLLAGLVAPVLWRGDGAGAAIPLEEAATVKFGELQVPAMGVGAWAWGDQAVWGFGTAAGASEASIEGAFRASLDSGVTLVDTAEVYGLGVSETIIGKLLAATPADLRSRVQVATKFYPVDPKSNLPRRARDLLPALDASLARLQLPSVDLYQVHNPGFLPGKALGAALAEAVKSGRCKAVGVSNFSLREMMPVYEALEKEGILLASNQVEFSLLRQLPLTGGLLSACRGLGVGVMAYSPLGMGRLTGKYDARNKAPGGRFFGRVDDGRLDALATAMREVGAVHGGKTPAQVTLAWRTGLCDSLLLLFLTGCPRALLL